MILCNNNKLINKFKFTKIEAKFLILVVAQINHDDPTFKQYILYKSEFTELFHNKDIDFKELSKELLSKPIDIDVNDGFLVANLFSGIEDTKDVLKITISQKIKPYLIDLKERFKSYELENIIKLEDEYSINIYLFLNKYRYEKNKIVSVADMQEVLNIPESLLAYSNFKRKVIKVAVDKINKDSNLNIEFQEMKTGRKITHINFLITTKYGYEEVCDLFKDDTVVETKTTLETTKGVATLENITNEKQLSLTKKQDSISEQSADIKRIVALFDLERKALQPNYVRREYRNMDGEYLLRVHMKETGRTPEMFFDAIRWLFSNNPKAEFPRQYIMNIGKLIEHFNSIEHQAMYSKEALQFNDDAKKWANIYKKQGMSDEQIIEELKKGGYVK